MYQHASRLIFYIGSFVKWDWTSLLKTSTLSYEPDTGNDDLSEKFALSHASDIGDSELLALADDIKRHAECLARFAARKNIRPSLGAHGDTMKIAATDTEALQSKAKLLHSLKKLQALVKGPREMLMDIGAHEILCLQAISRFGIAQAMQNDDEVPFEELSRRCGLNVKDLQRILRYAMTNFIFCEPSPGIVCHTEASKTLAQDSLFRDFIANVCEIRFPASARAVDALEKYGESASPSQSGFSLSRNTNRGLYDELAQYPEEARRWNAAMSALAQQLDMDWISASFHSCAKSIARPTLVDVGGGRGQISLALAKRWPDASFIVQDASDTAIAQGQQDTSAFKDRIVFQSYDFRSQQPYHNADVYYFKNIFHNWPDASCVQILRNQIPALKPGAMILIDDFTLHEPGTLSWSEERRRRWMDINMLVFFGSQERTLGDWRDLLATADSRFRLLGIDSAPNQHNSIIRVLWKGQ